MFNKLVSSLPFNPSLINQVSFYAKRLKQEASIRRLGFILVVLTMVLQLFAVFSPATPTLARTGNDIVPGGFTSVSQLVSYCRSNTYDLATILGHFAIKCDYLVNNSHIEYIHSTDANNQLYSMGRLPQGPVNKSTGKITNEVPIQIGQRTYYMRLLSSWDSGGPSTYKALAVGNGFFVKYYILFTCGNIVQIGKPAVSKPPAKPVPPPAPKPQPNDVCPLIPGIQSKKSECLPCPQSTNNNDVANCLVSAKTARNITQEVADANNTIAKAGDEIIYKLVLKNNAKIKVKTTVSENMTDVLEYANITNLNGGAIDSNNIVNWPEQTINAGATIAHFINIKVKNPIPNTPSPCPPSSTVSKCPKSGSFDLIMTNTYGNTININLPETVIKTTEKVTTTTLPNTGPGAGIVIGASLTVVVGYFFARSRLMAEELDIIKNEYTASGGA